MCYVPLFYKMMKLLKEKEANRYLRGRGEEKNKYRRQNSKWANHCYKWAMNQDPSRESVNFLQMANCSVKYVLVFQFEHIFLFLPFRSTIAHLFITWFVWLWMLIVYMPGSVLPCKYLWCRYNALFSFLCLNPHKEHCVSYLAYWKKLIKLSKWVVF